SSHTPRALLPPPPRPPRDPRGVRPPNSPFSAGNVGVRSFTATLKTAGSQSLTATDTVTGSINGSQTGITVNPAAASTLTVSGFPSPTTAGVSNSFTVTAKDAFGNTATGYLGTVRFTSSHVHAMLSANYTFTACNIRVRSF